MRRGSPAARAFTILELIIVLTVLGLLIGITAPRLVGSASKAQARQAVRGLADAITAERAETIRSMRPGVLFVVSDPGGEGAIRLVGYEPAGADQQPSEPPTAEALAASMVGGGEPREPFRSLGVWSGAVTASAPGAPPAGLEVRTLRIDPMGRVRLDQGGAAIALVASGDGDTIWRLGFDPISGVPSVSTD